MTTENSNDQAAAADAARQDPATLAPGQGQPTPEPESDAAQSEAEADKAAGMVSQGGQGMPHQAPAPSEEPNNANPPASEGPSQAHIEHQDAIAGQSGHSAAYEDHQRVIAERDGAAV